MNRVRPAVMLLALALTACGAGLVSPDHSSPEGVPAATAQGPVPGGRILFMRKAEDGVEHYFTIKADGTYGKEVFAAHQLDTGHPAFLEQVNDAEWLHALTGEMDPNAGNMRLELQRGPTGTVSQQLKLFDFDFSFGSAVQDPTVTHSGNNRTTLPPLVSERTLGAFANLAQN